MWWLITNLLGLMCSVAGASSHVVVGTALALPLPSVPIPWPALQISKLVVHGVDRGAALAGMRRALDSYVIRGVQHNAPLLRSVLDVPSFVAGNLSTAFLAENYATPEASAPERLPLGAGQQDQLLAVASLLWVGKEQRLSGGGKLQVGERVGDAERAGCRLQGWMNKPPS